MIWTLMMAAQAETLVVGDGGYATISEAVDAAVDGDTLEIAGGTWSECIDAGKSLTLVGDGSTVLDGTGICDSNVLVDDGESVTLRDLELVNAGGRGLNVYFSDVAAEGVVFRDSGGDEVYGGGVYTYGGTLTTSACSFTGNTGVEGGAAYLYAYTIWTDTDSVFEDNSSSGVGGAVMAYYDNTVWLSGTAMRSNVAGESGGALWHGNWGSMSMASVEFADNSSGGQGGAVFLYVIDEEIPLSDSTFSGNSALSHGGAIAHEWYSDLVITSTHFEGNSAGGYGGALNYWYYANLDITDSTFVDNSAPSGGGGVCFYGYQSSTWSMNITDSTFTGNSTDGSGGGVYASYADAISVEGSTFEGNSAGGSGGGLFAYASVDTQVGHADFCNNTSGTGGGASIQWAGIDAVWNSRFLDNVAAIGGGLHRYASYGGVIAYNDLVGNTGTDDGGGYYADYGYGHVFRNIVAHTPDGNGVVAKDVYSLANTELSDNGFVDNHVLDGGGYFYVEDGTDGNVVAREDGFASYTAGATCAEQNTRLVRDAALAGMGSTSGPDATIEDFDSDGSSSDEDCDDLSADVFPDAEETCDGLDEDCDSVVDEGAVDAPTWYTDADGDGYGTEGTESCTAPVGTSPVSGDCDDGDPEVNPGAPEVLDDGLDNNCDGVLAVTPDPLPEADPLVDGESRNGCSTVPVGGFWLAGLVLLWRRRLET